MFKFLQEAIKEGLTDLTIYRTDRGWQASSRWRSSAGWRVSIEKDIEIAVKGALSVARSTPEDTLKVDLGADLI